MFRSLGRLAVLRRRWILGGSLVFLAVAGILGGGVVRTLTTGGFVDTASESSHAAATLAETFGAADPNLVLLVTSSSGRSVDDPSVAHAGLALTAELKSEQGVDHVASYWSLGSAPQLRSRDGSEALVLARVAGSVDEVRERLRELSPAHTRDGAIAVRVGGEAEVRREIGEQVEHDLVGAESIAIPITLVLLILVFGSVVAALLPLGIAGLAVLGTFLALRVISSFTEVSVFSINLTTGMGLGLAIDYSLFIVSRFREELRAGREPHDAVLRTVETAGRTVAFSALTVAISLAALLIFPLSFLRSFAYAGIAVVAVAAAGALVVLPALLAVLGRRIDALVLWRRRPRQSGASLWQRLASAVMRRPLPIATAIVALLLVLGSPFLRIDFGLTDDRVLPPDAPAREFQDRIRTAFGSTGQDALDVVAVNIGDTQERVGEIAAYAERLSTISGVARVDALTGSYVGGRVVAEADPSSARFAATGGTWLSVLPSVEPVSPEGRRLVREVRAMPAPFHVEVGGQSAQFVDTQDALFDRAPIAALLIALVTVSTLFLMTGSVLVPLKAVVLNLLSLSATFGAMVWVFQDGNLAGLLGFTPTGTIDTTMPIVMFCVAFGLSMDYEVFLLSRIKEEYERTGDNAASVAAGLQRTGRIVTAAALLLSVVFIAFATSEVTFIKLLGLGMATAIIVDATLIRAALVPAFMLLAGRANWWAPRPLRRFHARFGIREQSGGLERKPA